MKVISVNGLTKLHFKKTCAAIGIFDGVHRGHQYLLKEMLKTARRLKAQPIVITFFPHPAHVLRPDIKLGYLTSLPDKYRLLKELGIKTCIVVKFDRAFAKIEPEKFIKDCLVDEIDVKAIFVGENFRFGKDRSGDVHLFQKLASVYGYEMHAMPGLRGGGDIISSTRIRRLISEGNIKEASQLLGRPVFVSGEVVKGSQRGKSLGYPTANINYESDILPPGGVYIVKLKLGTKSYPSIANLGTRPSFDKQKTKLLLEVHVLDFKKNIYGKYVEIEFIKKLRNEKKFPNPQALIQQIQKDEIAARKFFSIPY